VPERLERAPDDPVRADQGLLGRIKFARFDPMRVGDAVGRTPSAARCVRAVRRRSCNLKLSSPCSTRLSATFSVSSPTCGTHWRGSRRRCGNTYSLPAAITA
jgi:hypothetical protein